MPVDLQDTLEALSVLAAFTILYLQNLRQNKKVVNVEETLTTKNGGVAGIKDQLDRIESKTAEQEDTLNHHLKWSDSYVRTTEERIGKIETILISRATPARRRWFL